MPDPLTAVGAAGVGASLYGTKKAGEAAESVSDQTLQTAREAEALNRERFGEAQQLLSPYIQRSDIAQQQLMSELGLPVSTTSPYMQQQQAVEQQAIAQQGAETTVSDRMAERGIPQYITTQTPTGRTGRGTMRSEQVINPEYERAYQEELANVRAAPTQAQSQAQAQAGAPQTAAAPGTGYRGTEAYQNLMGAYDPYADVIGTPSYEDITAPLQEYQDLVRGDAVRAPIEEYQRMLNEGVDVTQLPGYQKMIQERTAAVNQGAAGAGALYSGRRGEALAEVGGETEREFYSDYMNRQQQLAGQLSGLEETRLGREGQLASAFSGIEAGRLGRFGDLTSARAGTESQFYSNYMNMLQNLGSPNVAQNLASLGTGQAATIGQQNIASQQAAGQTQLQGVGAENAALADLMKGGTNIATAYMNQQQPQQYSPQIIPQQTGYTNPNFSPTAGNYSPVAQPDYMAGF